MPAGPKKKQLDYSKLDALLCVKVTKAFCADYLGVSQDTIDRRIKEDHGMCFTDYQELKLARTGYSLQRKALEMALGGSVPMMIFALKNIAKWADRTEEVQTIIEKFEFTKDKKKED